MKYLDETLKIILVILATSIVCGIFICLFKIPIVKFIENEFLLGYLAAFLGFAFSIITYTSSLTSRLIDNMNDYLDVLDNDKVKELERINYLSNDLHYTLQPIFLSLIITVGLTIWESIDIPFISLHSYQIDKVLILKSIKFSVFFLSLFVASELIKDNRKIIESINSAETGRMLFFAKAKVLSRMGGFEGLISFLKKMTTMPKDNNNDIDPKE